MNKNRNRNNPLDRGFTEMLVESPDLEKSAEDYFIKFRDSSGISELKRINYKLETGTLEIRRANKAHNFKVDLNKINWHYKVVQLWEESFAHDCMDKIMRFCIIFFIENRPVIKPNTYDYITIYKTESGPGRGRELIIDLKFIVEEITEKFLKISYSSQWIILADLRLLNDSDDGKDHKELMDDYICRAGEGGVLQEFYDKVNDVFEVKEIDDMVDGI